MPLNRNYEGFWWEQRYVIELGSIVGYYMAEDT